MNNLEAFYLVAVLLVAGISAGRLQAALPQLVLRTWSIITGVLGYAFLLDSGRLRGGYTDTSLAGTLLAVWALAGLYRWSALHMHGVLRSMGLIRSIPKEREEWMQ